LGFTRNDNSEVTFSEGSMSHNSQSKFNLLKQIIESSSDSKFWIAPYPIRMLDGMSGQSFRFTLNKFLSFQRNTFYLEIGTWKGSTLCSALYENYVTAWAIDNWAEFGGPTKVAMKNIAKVLTIRNSVSIINSDYKLLNFGKILENNSVDCYLFDGPHSENDHYLGAKLISNLFFDSLVFIVDDWNWPQVRTGTLKGLEEAQCKVVATIEIKTNSTKLFKFSRWHNGYCFFIIEKEF
jgi:hypothetical protein